MPGSTGPSLDDEGMPDLDGPAPGKDETGDPQEGLPPPGDKARASVDWGVTADEQREGEPIGVRVERELPEVGATDPVDDVAEDLGLERDPLDDFEPPDDIDADVAVDLGIEEDDAESDVLSGRELVGDDLLADDEKDLVAAAVPTDPLEGQSAEEGAMRVVEGSDQ